MESASLVTRPRTVHGQKCTPEEVEHGLLVLAECNGNFHRAAGILEEQGLRISQDTLRCWMKGRLKGGRYAKRYEEIRAEVLPKIQERAAERHMELADKAMDVELLIAERLKEKVKHIEARDLPGAQRNVATTSAVHVDKALLLRGEPTEIHGQKDISGTLRKLKARGWDFEAKRMSDGTFKAEAVEDDGEGAVE